MSSNTSITPRGRFIQINQFRPPNKSHSNRQSSLLPSRQSLRQSILLKHQIHIIKHLINLFLQFLFILNSLKSSNKFQMFFTSQIIKQNIMLRTNPHDMSKLTHLAFYIIPESSSRSISNAGHTCKHRNGGSFSSSIMTQKAGNMILIHSQTKVIYSSFSIRIFLG